MTTQSPTQAASKSKQDVHEKVLGHLENAFNCFEELTESGASVADGKLTEMYSKVENLLNAIKSFKDSSAAKPKA